MDLFSSYICRNCPSALKKRKGVFDEFLMTCLSEGKGTVALSPGYLIMFPVPLAPSGVG